MSAAGKGERSAEQHVEHRSVPQKKVKRVGKQRGDFAAPKSDLLLVKGGWCAACWTTALKGSALSNTRGA